MYAIIEEISKDRRGYKSQYGDYYTSIRYNCVTKESFEKNLAEAKRYELKINVIFF